MVSATGGGIAHFGQPFQEQRLLASGQAFVDLSHFSVLELTGEDRLTWLNSLCSQQITDVRAGDSTEALILDPQGHIEFGFFLIETAQATLLLCEPGVLASLVAHFERMRFRKSVAWRDVSATRHVFGFVRGGAAEHFATVATAPMMADIWPAVRPGGYSYALHSEENVLGELEPWNVSYAVFNDEQRSELLTAMTSGQLAAAGLLAYDALRIAAGRPSISADLDEKSLPHEVDLLSTAVHLNKGCYRGQETVAKVHNLGHPPRRSVLLHLDGSDAILPEPGAKVVNSSDDSTVGVVTSAARHFELGSLAFALLRRSTPEDATLIVRHEGHDIPASAQTIVPVSAGATRPAPKLSRNR